MIPSSFIIVWCVCNIMHINPVEILHRLIDRRRERSLQELLRCSVAVSVVSLRIYFWEPFLVFPFYDRYNIVLFSSSTSQSTKKMSRKVLLDSALRAAVNLQSSTIPTQLARTSTAFLSSAAAGGPTATLPDLSYDYNALEPAISAEIMEIHHTKHHNAYVTNLNIALEKLDTAMSTGDVSTMIALQGAIKFNGGGHLNHTLFWENCKFFFWGGGGVFVFVFLLCGDGRYRVFILLGNSLRCRKGYS